MTEPASMTTLDRARGGDRTALEELLEPHRDGVQRYLATMLGDDAVAEDLTQEAFIRAWSRLDQFEGRSRISTWLMQIAVNLARNHLRDTARDPHPRSPEDMAEHAQIRRTVISSIVRRESVAAIERAIDRLPPTLKESFVLFTFEGLPYQEISTILGVSENTLQVRVHRARQLLRQQLGPVVEDLGGQNTTTSPTPMT